MREVDGAVPLLRRVVRRRVPAQRTSASGPRDGRADPRSGEERVQPRDRPDPDLRAQRRGHRPAARARGRPAPVADDRRRRVPALPLRRRQEGLRQGHRRPRGAHHAGAAPPAVRVRQRHRQPPGRLRPDGRAVPARAQPDRSRAQARVPGLGRRAAVPDRPQHPHGDPHPDRRRGVHQPHLAVPPAAARRPDAVRQPALVPDELDGDRVQPALPLAQPRPVQLPDRRPRRAGARDAVQHRPRAGARARRLHRGRVEAAGRARRACSTRRARCGTPR